MKTLDCPRCGAPLKWRRLRGWQTYLECQECFSAFEIVVERHFEPCSPQSQFMKFIKHTLTLQPGRTRTLKRSAVSPAPLGPALLKLDIKGTLDGADSARVAQRTERPAQFHQFIVGQFRDLDTEFLDAKGFKGNAHGKSRRSKIEVGRKVV